MARPTRRRALTIVALVLDVLALTALAVDVVAAYHRDIGTAFLLTGVAVPLALAGSVTSGVVLARSIRRIPRGFVIAGVAVITVAVVPIGGLALLIAAGATPNPAASTGLPLEKTVEAAGGHRLCGDGDPGLGPDNTEPYFFTEYEVPAAVHLRPRLVAQAQQLGWPVSDDPGGLASRTPEVLIQEGGTTDTQACGVYGKTVRASAGTHLVELEVALPYR